MDFGLKFVINFAEIDSFGIKRLPSKNGDCRSVNIAKYQAPVPDFHWSLLLICLHYTDSITLSKCTAEQCCRVRCGSLYSDKTFTDVSEESATSIL